MNMFLCYSVKIDMNPNQVLNTCSIAVYQKIISNGHPSYFSKAWTKSVNKCVSINIYYLPASLHKHIQNKMTRGTIFFEHCTIITSENRLDTTEVRYPSPPPTGSDHPSLKVHCDHIYDSTFSSF